MDPRVEWLTVSGDPDVWRSIGFVVTDDGHLPLHGTSLRIVHPGSLPGLLRTGDDAEISSSATGIVGWALSGITEHSHPASTVAPAGEASEPATDSRNDSHPGGSTGRATDGWFDIDGLPTEIVDARGPRYADHEIGAVGLDHVVVMTSQLERTSDAIAGVTGCELKRIRDLGEMRQGFHRIGRGGLIVELVERPDIPDGPASFWGLVVNVDDLDAACARLGADRVSPPKDAVQPGRRIATVRSDVGLGLPVALMTP
ncbi:MAG: VOC family protein [Ilumatobacteraceae bacterium]